MPSIAKRSATLGRWLRVLNLVAVIVVGTVIGIQLGNELGLTIKPSNYGNFGIGIDAGTWQVNSIAPGSAADKAGIKIGDNIIQVSPPISAITLSSAPAPVVGQPITVQFKRGSKLDSLTFRAAPLRWQLSDQLGNALLIFTAFIYFVVGAALALLRPSKMTWGFYLLSLGMAWLPNGGPMFTSADAALRYVIAWQAILVSVAMVGFIFFFLRFPTNRPTGWHKTLDTLIPLILLFLIPASYHQTLAQVVLDRPDFFSVQFGHVWDSLLVVSGVVGVTALIGTYSRAQALERHRIKWVVFGLICAAVGFTVASINFEGFLNNAFWLAALGESLVIVLPITVAYAVIRYRVIDVHFVASRALVFSVLALLVGALVFSLDWLFSTRFTNSRFETASYAAIALLIGLSLNAARQYAGRTVDSLFFRRWFIKQEALRFVADSILRADAVTDIYEPLTVGLSGVFSLASCALFEELADGGFVRVAAHGWPPGTSWHLLPNDRLTRQGETATRPCNIETAIWTGEPIPLGVARPAFMIPIVARAAVAALLLLGDHNDGSALDPDEVRAITRLCKEAALVYTRAPSVQYGGSFETNSSISPVPVKS